MLIVREGPPRPSRAKGLPRRRVVGGLAGLVTIASRSTAAAPASPVAGGTRLVETIHGPVAVPAAPRRVVALTYISAIAAAELGVLPVGIPRWVPDLPPGFPDLARLPKIENEAYELDLEAVLALEPDLILGSDAVDPADQSLPYAELSRIAPTALFAWTSGGANWEHEAAGCAEALGKTTAFAALRQEYDAKAAAMKTAYAGLLPGLTMDFVDAGEAEWYLHGPASTHCQVALDAGIHLGAGAALAETFAGYSFEQLNLLAATTALEVRAAPDPSLTILEAVPIFGALPAVAAGQVFTSAYFYVASYAQSDALLDELDAALTDLAGA